MNDREMWQAMGAIFATSISVLAVTSLLLTKRKTTKRTEAAGFAANGSKREGEAISLKLAVLWIGAVVVVILTQAYEHWGSASYMAFCAPCAALYVTVPYAFPGPEDKKVSWKERYITKANVWIGVFSFIGNYWYTHYFYRVLKVSASFLRRDGLGWVGLPALTSLRLLFPSSFPLRRRHQAKYTFEAYRLNDVPLCLYLMTHAYFMFYHSLSNFAIRWIRDTYLASGTRAFFEWIVIGFMSYATAFGEALTICAFPYYSFENRNQAYVLGSAFYGIYFLVSYPMFFVVDEGARRGAKHTQWSLGRTAMSALAAGMAVMCLLDFVRLYLGVELFATY